MNKFDVEMSLGRLAEQQAQWAAAQREFTDAREKALTYLIHQASRNYMSVAEVSRASGLPVARVRSLMRKAGLNPKSPRALLAEQSAKALTENAELLGIEPGQMDLTSPLAYLPMGQRLKDELIESRVARVTEVEL